MKGKNSYCSTGPASGGKEEATASNGHVAKRGGTWCGHPRRGAYIQDSAQGRGGGSRAGPR